MHMLRAHLVKSCETMLGYAGEYTFKYVGHYARVGTYDTMFT